jgi:hypothetical protein
MGWDGMGWDGMGWDRMGWDRMDMRHPLVYLKSKKRVTANRFKTQMVAKIICK